MTWKPENTLASAGAARRGRDDLLRRPVQRREAEAAAILDLQLEAADVPKPCTAGGGNTAMYASWIDANFWFSAPRSPSRAAES